MNYIEKYLVFTKLFQKILFSINEMMQTNLIQGTSMQCEVALRSAKI